MYRVMFHHWLWPLQYISPSVVVFFLGLPIGKLLCLVEGSNVYWLRDVNTFVVVHTADSMVSAV